MLVKRFLDKLSKAAPAERVDIVRAFVRVYLEVPLDAENREAAATALVAILDDPAPRVRRAMAEALCSAGEAPAMVIRALADDQPDIAAVVLSRSPLLSDAELVDRVGAGCARLQCAVADRPTIGIGLAAAIVEVSGPEACLHLLDNPGASIGIGTLNRLVDRHRDDPAVRNALLERPDLPVTLRQKLIDGLSDALGALISLREWVSPERAEKLVGEARERSVVELALECEDDRLKPYVKMLLGEGRITPAVLIRALALGNVRFVEEALSALSGMPVRRVVALLNDRSGRGLDALFRRIGLSADALSALRAVLEVMREEAPDGSWRHQQRLGRTMLERALTRHRAFSAGEVDAFFALISRLSAEAARREARGETGGYFRAA